MVMDQSDGMRLTPLFAAAFNGNYELTRELLEDGAKHQASNAGGFTALHYAAMLPDLSLMSRLLKVNGPDFEAFYEHLEYSIRTRSSSNEIFE
jgi:ankyrin repeat protein